MNRKKYVLKPGKHQFVPGEHARHDNDSISDGEAEWYLMRYPHIAKLFITQQKNTKTGDKDEEIISPKKIRNRKIRNQNT